MDRPTDAERPLTGLRILVAEDQYYQGDDVRGALARAGAEVTGPTPTLAQAVLHSERDRFDCAVLDINLRGLHVFPLARSLRDAAVPIVFATGYDRSVVPPDLADAPLLEKPLDLLRLIAMVCEAADVAPRRP